MTELKRGDIAINKKQLLAFVETVRVVENNIDIIMRTEKESLERGKKIAEQLNILTFERHAFTHFQLGVDLKKLK